MRSLPKPAYREILKMLALPIFFTIILAIKLLIITGNEIVSEGSDSVEYLLLAKAWFWGSVQNPIRGPGYPVFLAVLNFFNLPLRITSEVFLAIGAAWFCHSLMLIRLRKPAVVAIYVTILFHPLVILNMDMPMSEGLFVTFSLFSLGALVRVLMLDSFRLQLLNSLIFGLSCILMIHTRESDKSMIFLLLAEVFLCAFILDFIKNRSFLVWRSFSLFGAAAAPIILINLLVFSANYFTFGNFGYNKISNSSKLNFIHTLMLIDTNEAPLHSRILVTTKARKIAYELSPSLRPYQEYIENVHLKNMQESAFRTYARTGVKGQLDTEDTMGMVAKLCERLSQSDLNEQTKSTAKCDLHLDMISKEILDALDAAKAPRRTVFFILNPSLDLLVLEVRNSLSKIFASFFKYADDPVQDYYPFYGPLFSELYDTMANRNVKLLKKGPLEGYIVIPKGEKIRSIGFANDAINYFRRTSGDPQPFNKAFKHMKDEGLNIYIDFGIADSIAPVDEISVPDVLRRTVDGSSHDFFRFTVPAVKDRVFLHFTSLTIALDSGSELVVRDIDLGSVRVDASNKVRVLATSFELQLTPLQNAGYDIQKWVLRVFNKFSMLAAALIAGLTLLCIMLSMWSRNSSRPPGQPITMPLVISAILASTICVRIFFYAVVDATFFSVNLQRHLFPVSILLFPMLIIFLCLSIHALLQKQKNMLNPMSQT
jgi:hypothetical protein